MSSPDIIREMSGFRLVLVIFFMSAYFRTLFLCAEYVTANFNGYYFGERQDARRPYDNVKCAMINYAV